MQIETIFTAKPKDKPDFKNLGFGKYFSDHMFIMKYTEGRGWHDAKIVPYAPIPLDPSALVLHYGQETFEGLKAYKDKEEKITLFRPRDNFRRMNKSNDRMCMPQIDVEAALNALKKLLLAESGWIPTEPDTSLYIRPFIIATEPSLGVKVSKEYLFVIILSPVGSYYPEGLKPTSIYVEEYYIRSAEGGTGDAKISGNYAASLKPYENAKRQGFSQVLFLDGKEKKYIEEVGTSNAFFVINGELYTTPLSSGTILPGITRDSVIQIAKDKGLKVNEKALSIEDVFSSAEEGHLDECFASGTAAVVSPIGSLTYRGKTISIAGGNIGEITQDLYNTLTGIQYGRLEDKFGWVEAVN
ncbi:MAG: branched-chain amino acid aminotransferase [Eubacteriaceae bacterium]|jgi:branched-chain amino acid aminotransferase|nr:branched-chain amino acid aminotransferase [Eubacteriaceae bacterium]